MVYEVEKSRDLESGKLTSQYITTHRSTAKVNYSECREVVGFHQLKKGTYIILVSTFEPNQETGFMLRIWS